jgi:hypothetical protein
VTVTDLVEAEQVLGQHSPNDFDSVPSALPEVIAAAARVEDTEAWRHGYPSLEMFYVSHEGRHPDIRLYGELHRSIETIDPVKDSGGTLNERFERLRAQRQSR